MMTNQNSQSNVQLAADVLLVIVLVFHFEIKDREPAEAGEREQETVSSCTVVQSARFATGGSRA
jgi:hypothetical protein